MQITTHSRNLLNVVAHESVPNRQRWTYRHDGKWHVPDERPVITRNDYVVVNVKEVYVMPRACSRQKDQKAFTHGKPQR